VARCGLGHHRPIGRGITRTNSQQATCRDVETDGATSGCMIAELV
jgi:hypothetical protein